MGAGALLCAAIYGTKAHYFRELQKGDSKNKKYIDDLPVFPIARAKLKANQLKVLKIISESIYAIKDVPSSADSKLVEGFNY